MQIVARGLEAPMKQIAANAGIEGAIVVDKVKHADKVGYGFDAATETYGDMIANGIVDPTKVNRSALQNAASVASMVLTTESLVADKKEPVPAAPAAVECISNQEGKKSWQMQLLSLLLSSLCCLPEQ